MAKDILQKAFSQKKESHGTEESLFLRASIISLQGPKIEDALLILTLAIRTPVSH